MRSHGLAEVALCAFATSLAIAASAPSAPAATPAVAWSLHSLAVPTNFSPGDVEPEILQVAVSATGGAFALEVEGERTVAHGEASLTSGSPTVSAVTTTGGVFLVGQLIEGTGIPVGTTITSVGAGALTMSANAEATGTQPLTGRLPFNAPASLVQSALDALPSIGGAGGSVTVTGGPGDEAATTPYRVTLDGGLQGENLKSFAINVTRLTGGSQESAVEKLQKGRFRDRYTISLTNIGSVTSNGTVTLTDTLPAGVVTSATPFGFQTLIGEVPSWQCSEGAGQTVVTCTSTKPVAPFTAEETLFVPVKINPGASEGPSEARASGGGAPLEASASSPTSLRSFPPSFGLVDFAASAVDESGSLDTQASSHPAALATTFDQASVNTPQLSGLDPSPVEDLRRVVVDLPAGVVGDAQAAPTCPLVDLANFGHCPQATQVGTMTLYLPPWKSGTAVNLPIFNVFPERGHPAEFGVFEPLTYKRAALLYASVRSGSDYGVRVISQPLPQALPIIGVSTMFFGNPAAVDNSGNAPVPFFTNPSDCTQPGFNATIHVDTWQHPGSFNADGTPNFNDPNWKTSEQPAPLLPKLENCSALRFDPELHVEPNTTKADAPSGYQIDLRVPQNEDPNGLATPPLKNAVVTLPAGVSVSPSAADGLIGCPPAGAEGVNLTSDEPAHCPTKSVIGSVKILTPLLKEPLEGNVYVAKPACGASGQPACLEADAEEGRIFKLYLAAEGSGVHIKLPGTAEVGGNGQYSRSHGLASGQIRTTFANTPQQPFSELKLHLSDGARAPLANPQTCGQFITGGALTPWSSTTPATPGSAFNVDWDGAGGPCPATPPFTPSFSAGTVNPQAAAFSPFTLTFARHDREQNLAGITVSMPAGLLGKIAGIPQCPDAQANAGTCAAASRIGSATAAAGSGSHPLWQSGTVYLTGPYKGAPFGLSFVVPAVAGPYNLGDIIVRAAIYVDPHTAQLTVVSDQLPQSVDGVPLRVQTINVTVDRPAFMFNPTSCGAQQVGGTISGLQGASANAASAFAVAGCRTLPFQPTFSATTAGNGGFHGASLDVKITQKPGEAAIHKVDTQLPLALPSRLVTLQKACPEAQFASNAAGCPAGSDVGIATATTPVLNVPLTGPAYLVSHGGAAFPDLDVVLQGEGVKVILVGNSDIKKGITYSRFETVPDAPVSSFELNLRGGRGALLAATKNLCAPTRTVTSSRHLTHRVGGHLKHVALTIRKSVAEPLRMPTTMIAQNGATLHRTVNISVTGCHVNTPRKRKPSSKKTRPKKR
jgi:hypothetical protein